MRPDSIYRIALIFATAVPWATPTPVTAGEDARTTITVRLYQAAGLRSTAERRALEEADAVLRTAHVEVRWTRCIDEHPSPACVLPRAPSELLVRILDEEVPGQNATLGNAVVTPGEGGVLATVYLQHVVRVAQDAGSDVAVLLGRVIAHEIGHLMMHTPAHAPHGVMRANWTRHEIRHGSAIDWKFTAEDIAAMDASIARRVLE